MSVRGRNLFVNVLLWNGELPWRYGRFDRVTNLLNATRQVTLFETQSLHRQTILRTILARSFLALHRHLCLQNYIHNLVKGTSSSSMVYPIASPFGTPRKDLSLSLSR